MKLVEDEKLNFAVFIDYDNIEIGVKSTLNREFDVKCVLDGIKERGEISAKIAYANWGRQTGEARKFTENGVQMVQRDTTPRGDKNGADINLALDALEMAFTRDHINAFAIVSGDSDFMALVNKLKQYNKRVYIVGGKAFTSTILQRNCHEFISYESLLDQSSPCSRRGGGPSQRGRSGRSLPLSQAIPLINRALSALDRRGAQPQLGLLKSTVLQLDSSFTERDYGASSFSNFIQKLVVEGILSLTTIDGHHVVERKSEAEDLEVESATEPEDAIVLLGEVLQANLELLEMGIPAREVKALVQAVEPDFNETDYGFSEFAELLNFAQDKGVVRGETDSSANLRFYAGDELSNLTKRPRKKAEAKPALPAGDRVRMKKPGASRRRRDVPEPGVPESTTLGAQRPGLPRASRKLPIPRRQEAIPQLRLPRIQKLRRSRRQGPATHRPARRKFPNRRLRQMATTRKPRQRYRRNRAAGSLPVQRMGSLVSLPRLPVSPRQSRLRAGDHEYPPVWRAFEDAPLPNRIQNPQSKNIGGVLGRVGANFRWPDRGVDGSPRLDLIPFT